VEHACREVHERFRRDYCTVSFNAVECDNEPAAAVTVSEYDCALAELPVLPDTAALERMVSRARRELDFGKAQQLRSGIASHETKLAAALKALPLWSGAVDDLEAVPVPAAEFV